MCNARLVEISIFKTDIMVFHISSNILYSAWVCLTKEPSLSLLPFHFLSAPLFPHFYYVIIPSRTTKKKKNPKYLQPVSLFLHLPEAGSSIFENQRISVFKGL